MKKIIYLSRTTLTGNVLFFQCFGFNNRPTSTKDVAEAKVFSSKKAAYEVLRQMPKDYREGWDLVGIF